MTYLACYWNVKRDLKGDRINRSSLKVSFLGNIEVREYFLSNKEKKDKKLAYKNIEKQIE